MKLQRASCWEVSPLGGGGRGACAPSQRMHAPLPPAPSLVREWGGPYFLLGAKRPEAISPPRRAEQDAGVDDDIEQQPQQGGAEIGRACCENTSCQSRRSSKERSCGGGAGDVAHDLVGARGVAGEAAETRAVSGILRRR